MITKSSFFSSSRLPGKLSHYQEGQSLILSKQPAMRKRCLLLFFLFIYHLSFGQDVVYNVAKSYFRANPFNKEFSSFLSYLLNDPRIKDKVMEKRTDSTLFYFQGTYTTHNPFFFKPKKVEVILSEMVIPIVDSLPPDTIFAYQLLAYDDDSKEGVQELKKEFEKIFKRYKNSFAGNQYTENSAATKIPGETYNFFDPLHAVSPFAISWFGPDEKKETCLVLTIRMDVYKNQAILPVPFYTLQ